MNHYKPNKTITNSLVLFAGLIIAGYSYGDGADVKNVQHSKYYVRANLNLPTYRRLDNYKSKFRVGGQAAIGWKCHRNIALELEGGYFSFPSTAKDVPARNDNRKIHSWVGFANVLYSPELFNHNELKPFAGIGLGYNRTSVGQQITNQGLPFPGSAKTSSTNFGYQLFLGAEWLATQNLSIIGDIRWIDLGKVKFYQGQPIPMDLNKEKIQTFTLGVKYNF